MREVDWEASNMLVFPEEKELRNEAIKGYGDDDWMT